MKIIYRSDLEDIVRGCRKGKREAQRALFDRYFEPMLAVCMRYVRHAEDAEDIVQESFIRIFQKIGDFRGEGSFEGWMRRIFVTQALMFCRSQKRNGSQQNEPLPDNLIEEDDSEVDSSWELNTLLGFVHELPEGYRNIFNLYVLDDFSHQEIATLLNISEGTSKSQLARARKLLRQRIAEHQHEQKLLGYE